jgi:PRTRC genetic system protein C
MPGKTRPEYANGAVAVSSRRRKTKSFATPVARKPTTVNKTRRFKMARKFIVDGTEYPDPGTDVTPEQFKQMMVGFLPELANADMTSEKQGEDTIYHFKKRVGVKG